jgi:hypothetical protein
MVRSILHSLSHASTLFRCTSVYPARSVLFSLCHTGFGPFHISIVRHIHPVTFAQPPSYFCEASSSLSSIHHIISIQHGLAPSCHIRRAIGSKFRRYLCRYERTMSTSRPQHTYQAVRSMLPSLFGRHSNSFILPSVVTFTALISPWPFTSRRFFTFASLYHRCSETSQKTQKMLHLNNLKTSFFIVLFPGSPTSHPDLYILLS